MRFTTYLIAGSMLFSSSLSFALDCEAVKGLDGAKIIGEKGVKHAVIGSYQFDVTELETGDIVLNIFDRRTPRSSTKTVIPGIPKGQSASLSLETQDGFHHIICK